MALSKLKALGTGMHVGDGAKNATGVYGSVSHVHSFSQCSKLTGEGDEQRRTGAEHGEKLKAWSRCTTSARSQLC